MVAIIADEPGRAELELSLAADSDRLTSALAVWEAARALAKKAQVGIELAEQQVALFQMTSELRIVAIDAVEGSEAVRAQGRYGKGTGHPAKLNMGDCFAYACAKTNGARLLYKGDDFLHTDLA